MKTIKMSLANIEGKLSRKEMKGIMAGSGEYTDPCNGKSRCGGTCTNVNGRVGQCMTTMWADCRCTTGTL